jgi:polysaccharide deacetylase family sporulation protein PdaB
MAQQPIRKKLLCRGSQLLTAFGMLLLTGAGMLLYAESAFAHGYIEAPASRSYLCKQGQNVNCGQIQYEPQSIEAPKGFPNGGPADNKIASGGVRGDFAELDVQAPDRWTKVNLNGGEQTFKWMLTAAHATSNWKYYITKKGWKPEMGLTRANLELFCTHDFGGKRPSAIEEHKCNVPTDRSGYHLILGVWEIADTSNAFYQVIDVNLNNNGTPDNHKDQTNKPDEKKDTTQQPPTPPNTNTPQKKPTDSVKTDWKAYHDYKVGDIVTFNGTTYECIQAHSSLPNWQPSIVPALWKPIAAQPQTHHHHNHQKYQKPASTEPEDKEQGLLEEIKQLMKKINEYLATKEKTPAEDTQQKPNTDENKQPNTDKNKKPSTSPVQPAAVFKNGPRTAKRIALTFDDGPNAQFTPQVLDILKEQKAKATFFVLGSSVQSHPDLAKRIVDEGHVIANHSWNHPHLPQIAKKEVAKELDRTRDVVKKVTGKEMNLMRPPYGEVNDEVLSTLGKRNLSVIKWDVDTEDWKGKSPEEIVQTAISHAQNGSIILMHDAGGDRTSTVQALRTLISQLKSQGYELVTVNQLLGKPAYN